MYIVKKKIKGKEYYYLNKAIRENGHVKSKNVAYLGKSREEAEKKAKDSNSLFHQLKELVALESKGVPRLHWARCCRWLLI